MNFKNFFIVIISAIIMIIITPVEAKRFSSSSFSRPSYSAKSYKKSTTAKKSTFNTSNKKIKYKNTTNFKFNAKKDVVKNNRFSKKSGFNENKNSAAVKAHKDHIKKFKKSKSSTLNSNDTKKYSNNSYVKSSHGYDKSTRLSRQSDYYGGYSTPSYVYQSSSSFGMWDSIAMWYMLDNISNRNQYQMAYHHQSDPGFQEWRMEANRLSADNAELRAKLSKFDAYVNSMEGTEINPNYVPEGVDRDILLSDAVVNNIKPELKICAGSINGSYSVYAHRIKLSLNNDFKSIIINTNGTNDNIKMLESGQCDIALVQRDAYDTYTLCSNNYDLKPLCVNNGVNFSKSTTLDFTRLSSPFKDSVIGLCNGIDNIEKAKTIALVDKGGDVLTWLNFQFEFPKLHNISTIKSKSMMDSIKKVSNKTADCTLIVTNWRSKILKSLDSFYTDGMQIINITNKEIYEIQDPAGYNVYEPQKLSTDVLGKPGKKNSKGFFKKYIENPKVPVDLIISNSYNTILSSKIKSAVSNITLH